MGYNSPMAIIGNKTAVRTTEFHKKMELRRKIKLGLFTILGLMLIALPIYLLRTSKFLISNIQIQGNNVTKDEEIQKIIDDDLQGNYLWIFPKSNALLFPKKKIVADLLNSIPRMSAVNITRLDAKSLQVSIEERTPFALYCKDVAVPTSPTNCFFLDKTGYIFSDAPSFSGGVYFVYSSEPRLESPLRQQYMNEKVFITLDPFIQGLAQAGLFPKVFVLKDKEYALLLSNGASVSWPMEQDLTNVGSNLQSFLNDPSFKNKQSINNLLYLKVLGNKIYYKLKDAVI